MKTEITLCPGSEQPMTTIRAHPNDGGLIREVMCSHCSRRERGRHKAVSDLHNYKRRIPESSIECEELNGRHGDISTIGRTQNGDPKEVCARCGY